MGFNARSLTKANDNAIKAQVLVCALLYQDPGRTALAVSTSGTDLFTLATAVRPAVGKRVTLSGTLPSTLAAGTVYFMSATTSSQFKLCLTLADALAGTGFVAHNQSSGSVNVYDETMSDADTLAALVTHEVSFSGYQRQTANFAASAVDVSGQAAAAATLPSFGNTSIATANVSHALFMIGGSVTAGTSTLTADGYYGILASTVQTIEGAQALTVEVKQVCKRDPFS